MPWGAADEAAPPRRGQRGKSPAELDFYGEFYAALCGAPVLTVLPKAKCGRRLRPFGARKGTPFGVPFRLIEFALQIPARRPLTLKILNESKSGGVYLGFLTLRGRKFPYGNFRTSVFCEVKTQIVGKTKFFDKLKRHA